MKLLSLTTAEQHQKIAKKAKDRKRTVEEINSKMDLTKDSAYTAPSKLVEKAFATRAQSSLV